MVPVHTINVQVFVLMVRGAPEQNKQILSFAWVTGSTLRGPTQLWKKM